MAATQQTPEGTRKLVEIARSLENKWIMFYSPSEERGKLSIARSHFLATKGNIGVIIDIPVYYLRKLGRQSTVRYENDNLVLGEETLPFLYVGRNIPSTIERLQLILPSIAVANSLAERLAQLDY